MKPFDVKERLYKRSERKTKKENGPQGEPKVDQEVEVKPEQVEKEVQFPSPIKKPRIRSNGISGIPKRSPVEMANYQNDRIQRSFYEMRIKEEREMW